MVSEYIQIKLHTFVCLGVSMLGLKQSAGLAGITHQCPTWEQLLAAVHTAVPDFFFLASNVP